MIDPRKPPPKFRGSYHFKGLSWRDLVRLAAARHGRADLSEEEVDWILWEHTAFPFCTPARICVQLHRFFTAQEGGT